MNIHLAPRHIAGLFMLIAVIAIGIAYTADAQSSVPCYPLRGRTTPALINNVANAGVIYFGYKTAGSPNASIWNPDAAPIMYPLFPNGVCGEVTTDANGNTVKVTLKGKAWNDNWGFMDFTGVFIDSSGVWHGTAKSLPVEQTGSLWLNWADESKETGLVPTSYWIESDEENPFADGFVMTKTSYAKLSSIGMLNFAGVLIPWDAGKLQNACDPAIADCDNDTYLIDSDPPKNDCSAFDASSFPQASEAICADGADNDCDGATDAADSDCGTPNDDDNDGYPEDLADPDYDCDDLNAAINPGASEICDDLGNIDEDCDFKANSADPECVLPPEDLTPDPASDDYDFLPPVIRGGGVQGTQKTGGIKTGYTALGGGNRSAMREMMARNYAALKREKGEPQNCPTGVQNIFSSTTKGSYLFSKDDAPIYYCKGNLYIKQTEPWTGSKTIVAENGNIFIIAEANIKLFPNGMYTFGLYPDLTDKNSQLGIVALQTDNPLNTGNVYVAGNVRYLRANIYADGSIYPFDWYQCSSPSNCSNLISQDGMPAIKRKDYSTTTPYSDMLKGNLQQQLVFEGTLSANNTFGGSDVNEPETTRRDFTYFRSSYCPRAGSLPEPAKSEFNNQQHGLKCVANPTIFKNLGFFSSQEEQEYETWWSEKKADPASNEKFTEIENEWNLWTTQRTVPKDIALLFSSDENYMKKPGIYFYFKSAPSDLPLFGSMGKSGTTQKRF